MNNEDHIQVVDPEVSKQKFEREITRFRKVEEKYRKKGVILLEQEYPTVLVAFTVPKLRPMIPIAFTVKLDFTNYDLEPPSIKFIDPLSGETLKRNQIPVKFLQVNRPEKLQQGIPIQAQLSQQDLLQGNPDTIPFFCMPGVKEYHNHPYHTGDSWFLYRTDREGELITLIDQLHDKGVSPINGYNIKQVISGFNINIDISELF